MRRVARVARDAPGRPGRHRRPGWRRAGAPSGPRRGVPRRVRVKTDPGPRRRGRVAVPGRPGRRPPGRLVVPGRRPVNGRRRRDALPGEPGGCERRRIFRRREASKPPAPGDRRRRVRPPPGRRERGSEPPPGRRPPAERRRPLEPPVRREPGPEPPKRDRDRPGRAPGRPARFARPRPDLPPRPGTPKRRRDDPPPRTARSRRWRVRERGVRRVEPKCFRRCGSRQRISTRRSRPPAEIRTVVPTFAPSAWKSPSPLTANRQTTISRIRSGDRPGVRAFVSAGFSVVIVTLPPSR